MAFEDTDRRRSLILGLLTLVALPAAYLYTRIDAATGPDDTTEIVDTIAPESGVEAGPLGDDEPSRPPIEATDDEPAFMEGPSSDRPPPVAEVAVPARPAQDPIRMVASYRRSIGDLQSCPVLDLPAGESITVTNLDNGRSITCVTADAPASQVAGIVLQTDAFSLLADLTEAPIPVEVVR